MDKLDHERGEPAVPHGAVTEQSCSVFQKIITQFWMKPIPLRQFDWMAFYDGDEPNDNGNMRHGSGRTEAEAVVDLIENHPQGVQCERWV